tara:strand:- start:749 stop:1210 length:462 start_codon:yes stop_codon:yes gene_type:complete
MKLHKRKRIVANLLGVGRNKISMDPEQREEIEGALTRRDLNSLVKQKVITVKKTSKQSKSRLRAKLIQKRKGRVQNTGSRKGSKKARNPPKKLWITKIRLQRAYLSSLKEKELISKEDYQILRAKSKGGFFRSVRHLKLYSKERNMMKEKNGN